MSDMEFEVIEVDEDGTIISPELRELEEARL